MFFSGHKIATQFPLYKAIITIIMMMIIINIIIIILLLSSILTLFIHVFISLFSF